jgi:hypothetical protein
MPLSALPVVLNRVIHSMMFDRMRFETPLGTSEALERAAF